MVHEKKDLIIHHIKLKCSYWPQLLHRYCTVSTVYRCMVNSPQLLHRYCTVCTVYTGVWYTYLNSSIGTVRSVQCTGVWYTHLNSSIGTVRSVQCTGVRYTYLNSSIGTVRSVQCGQVYGSVSECRAWMWYCSIT